MNDTDFMNAALEEARLAAEAGELPVGCVIAKDGAIIARAEMLAIQAASKALGDWRLTGCTLYVTLEPCPMCAGAAMQARLDRLVFGAPNPGQGCAGSLYRIPEDPAFPHFCPCDGGVRADACRALLDRFLVGMRQNKSLE